MTTTDDDEARRLIDSATPPALLAIQGIDFVLAQQEGRLQAAHHRLLTAETRADLTTVLALLMAIHDTSVSLAHLLGQQLSEHDRAFQARRIRPDTPGAHP